MSRLDSNAVLDRRNGVREDPEPMERAYLMELLGTAAGRWLIGNLCRRSGVIGASPKGGYRRGRRDIVWEQVASKIVAHFGYAPFTDLMKEEGNGR